MLESGIDPATVRFEVGRPAYCKYSIFLLENGFYNSGSYGNHYYRTHFPTEIYYIYSTPPQYFSAA